MEHGWMCKNTNEFRQEFDGTNGIHILPGRECTTTVHTIADRKCAGQPWFGRHRDNVDEIYTTVPSQHSKSWATDFYSPPVDPERKVFKAGSVCMYLTWTRLLAVVVRYICWCAFLVGVSSKGTWLLLEYVWNECWIENEHCTIVIFMYKVCYLLPFKSI